VSPSDTEPLPGYRSPAGLGYRVKLSSRAW